MRPKAALPVSTNEAEKPRRAGARFHAPADRVSTMAGRRAPLIAPAVPPWTGGIVGRQGAQWKRRRTSGGRKTITVSAPPIMVSARRWLPAHQ
jgi:hypothetical protein